MCKDVLTVEQQNERLQEEVNRLREALELKTISCDDWKRSANQYEHALQQMERELGAVRNYVGDEEFADAVNNDRERL